MRTHPETTTPSNAERLKAIPPVVCYPVDALPPANMTLYRAARQTLELVETVIVEPRQGRCFNAPAGHFFRIVSIKGSQVGDLNLWNANDLSERFYSGKTRALHATHISTGDRMWSVFPYLLSSTDGHHHPRHAGLVWRG